MTCRFAWNRFTERIIVTLIKTSVVPFALTATGTGTAQHLTVAG
jgi:hypothetical protein